MLPLSISSVIQPFTNTPGCQRKQKLFYYYYGQGFRYIWSSSTSIFTSTETKMKTIEECTNEHSKLPSSY